MMDVSQNVLQLCEQNIIKTFFLIRIQTSSNSYRSITSHYSDITMSDNITYINEGTLLSIEPPRYSNSVDRASYRILFSDSNFSFRSFFEQGAAGANVIVRLGFYNTIAGLQNTEINAPITNIDDTILVYRGFIDSHSYNIDLEQNIIQVSLECSSPMADLDLAKPYYTNDFTHKQFYPNDTAFQKVFEGSGTVKLNWGRV